MQLDTFLKSKVRWHLGYNQTSIPAGDLARLEEALDNIQDSYWYSKNCRTKSVGVMKQKKRTDMTGSVNNKHYTSRPSREILQVMLIVQSVQLIIRRH